MFASSGLDQSKASLVWQLKRSKCNTVTWSEADGFYFDWLHSQVCFSSFQALGQWGRSKKRAGDERGLGEKRRGQFVADPARRPLVARSLVLIVSTDREPGAGCCGLGFIPTLCHDSPLAPLVQFLQVLRFFTLHKTNTSKFQFHQNRYTAWKVAKAAMAFRFLNITILSLAINVSL